MRLMDAQTRWARPVANVVQGRLSTLFQRIRPIRDVLEGVWLGHPLHAALSDGPIGILFLVSVFDALGVIIGLDGAALAARVALIVGILAMIVAALSGLADYSETDGPQRARATLHGTMMLLALALYIVSLGARGDASPAPAAGVGISVAAFVVLVAGGFVGGDVVYAFGNMVSRHAFLRVTPRWAPIVLLDGPDISAGVLTKASLGGEPLVLVQTGESIHALHDLCAHAGGPLSQGMLVDGCIECPWHFSRFRVTDGRVVRGPSVYEQPTYEIRRTPSGGLEGRRPRR
jgi:nitrite reductase/ring-hydroxylating ferredoxin subunit/uncharacterized membrane protein